MIRLVLADDHPVVRRGLRQILAERGDIDVVAEAASADELMARLREAPVDVLLLDVAMPGPGLLAVLRQLKSAYPRLRSLVLSMYTEEQYAIRALKAGAAGYLTKDRPPEELVAAIQKVHRGGVYVSPTLAERLAGTLAAKREQPLHETLSDREFEVMKRLGAGESIKEIGARLALSPKTVSTYRSRILEKLRLKTNADLVRYLLEHGLGTP